MKALGAECHITGDTVRAVIPEVEADDPREFFDQMNARAGTDQLPISPALSSTASAVLWKELKSD